MTELPTYLSFTPSTMSSTSRSRSFWLMFSQSRVCMAWPRAVWKSRTPIGLRPGSAISSRTNLAESLLPEAITWAVKRRRRRLFSPSGEGIGRFCGTRPPCSGSSSRYLSTDSRSSVNCCAIVENWFFVPEPLTRSSANSCPCFPASGMPGRSRSTPDRFRCSRAAPCCDWRSSRRPETR